MEAQATFVAVTLRQMILAFPLKAARKWSDSRREGGQARSWTRLHTISARNSSSFPEKITDPDWLENLEGEA